MRVPAALLLVALLLPGQSFGRDVRNKRQIENPLEGVVAQLSQTVEELQQQVATLQNRLNAQTRNVAFMAQFAAEHPVGPEQGPYVFDQIVHNDGNAYDPSTGIFTAPYNGVYMFTAQLFTDATDSEHPFVDIEVNNSTIARLAFESGGGDTPDALENSDSTTITVKLQKGDRVWVASEEGVSYTYWGHFHTFFSGILLQADGTMTQ